jgi:lipopolysaccharide export system permease protein
MIQVLPIASLLAGTIVMVLFSRTNEITAMRACGMGPFRIALPVVSGGLFLSLAAFFLGEFVAPYASERMHYVQDVLIEGSRADEAITSASWRKINNSLFHFADYDPSERILHGVTITTLDSKFRTARIDFIRKATYNSTTGKWLADRTVTRSFTEDGALGSLTSSTSNSIPLPFEIEKLVKERRKTEELSLLEMKTDVNRGRRAGLDVASLYLDMHIKFAFYFASFFVSILGLRFAYRSERNVETARGVLVAIGIGISYWFILNAFKAIGKRGILTPMVAAWGANFCMMLAGIYELYKAKKA